VPLSSENSIGVVLLPPLRGRLGNGGLLRWLSQAQLERVGAPAEPLAEVLGALGRQAPAEGLAALRLWGQTGERPVAWIAAADPVYMEPQLDRLFLHALRAEDLGRSEIRRLFDGLQQSLGDAAVLGFAVLGDCGYIQSQQPMTTASFPASVLDAQNPDDWLPSASSAAATLRLISEVEMSLHQHPVNAERQSRGLPPVNSLWIWGGGRAPQQSSAPLPPLFADDPLLRGYWHSVGAATADWPGTIDACLDAAEGSFVAAMRNATRDATALHSALHALRDALRSGRLHRGVLLSADGIRATLRRSDRLRVWRRASPLLGGSSA
jgi:hypothetical protein